MGLPPGRMLMAELPVRWVSSSCDDTGCNATRRGKWWERVMARSGPRQIAHLKAVRAARAQLQGRLLHGPSASSAPRGGGGHQQSQHCLG